MRFLAALGALGLVLAACGSDDDESASGDGGDDGGGAANPDAELCDAGDAGEITIVHMTDVVGESGTAIDDFWNGSQLAAEHINEECGDIVTLERIPTDFSVEGFESKILEAQEMEPTAIIGQGSSSQMTLNDLVTEGEIPLLWPVGTATAMLDAEDGSEWAWMTRVVNDTQGLVWGTHLAEMGVDSVWLECVETQLGVSGCGEATPILEDAGIEIAGRNDSAIDESDFTQSIIDLKSAGADAVLLAQFPRPSIAFAQQMEDNDALDTLIFGSTSTEVVYGAMSPAQHEALVALADCNPREDAPDANEAYAAEYDTDMTSLAAVAYDSVHIIVDAVARMGSTENTAVAEGISSTEWDGACQDYRDNGSHALAHRMVVTSFTDGVITTEAEYALNDDGDGLAE
ncbi:MAG TPA: ABC transporter substrate-binding protein [Acidimicrobiales bacterium]